MTNLDKKANFSDNEFDLDKITKEFSSEESNDNDNNKQKEQNNNEESDNNLEESEENKTDSNIEQENNTTDQTNNEENTNQTSKVDENVFPLYLPSNTSLSDKEVIETATGERVIMTFSGDNPFILVQETVSRSNELEIIPTYGEPFMLIDTVGSLTDTSYTWTSNGIEYYIVSDQMNKNELLEVAKSINVVSAINEK